MKVLKNLRKDNQLIL